MKANIYTLLYALILGCVCALLLTGVGEFTRPYRQANKQAEEYRNILGVLGVRFDQGASSAELLKLFENSVEEKKLGQLTLYRYLRDDELKAVAVPVSGPGLWGPIKGFIALEPDMKTIMGVTFHEQEETPGLGGEIGAKWFRDQFKGKSIYGPDGTPGIAIVGGAGERARNEVDAISGATMTCDKVQTLLNNTITRLVEELEQHGE